MSTSYKISYGIDEDSIMSCEIKTVDGFDYEGELYDVTLHLRPSNMNLLESDNQKIDILFLPFSIRKNKTKEYLLYYFNSEEEFDEKDIIEILGISETLPKNPYKYVNLMWACLQEALQVWDEATIYRGFLEKLYEYFATEYDDLNAKIKINKEKRELLDCKLA